MNGPETSAGFDKNPAQMDDLEYSAWVAERMMGGWIPLAQYQRVYPEETQAKIDTRIARKVWLRGVHYVVPPQSRAWVNLPAIRAWIESGAQE